jgi:hypothetical protein
MLVSLGTTIHANYVVIGTCSLCGGPVARFRSWAGSSDQLPPAHCLHCRAVADEGYGPIITTSNPGTYEAPGISFDGRRDDVRP